MDLVPALARHRLLAIVRGTRAENTLPVMKALVESGVRCLEVTAPTPGGFEALAAFKSETAGLALGIGTVTTAAQAERAHEAGATFIVSPHLDEDLIARAAALGLATLPGVFTPSEAVRARAAGASALKLFPASVLGPGFLAALRAPLPGLAFVPTGGIGLADVEPWLSAGALAVAVGSPLIGDALEGGDLSALAGRAKDFVAHAAGASRHA